MYQLLQPVNIVWFRVTQRLAVDEVMYLYELVTNLITVKTGQLMYWYPL